MKERSERSVAHAAQEQSVVPRVTRILREGKLGPTAWWRAARLALSAGHTATREAPKLRRGYWWTAAVILAALVAIHLLIAREAPWPAALAATLAQTLHAVVALSFVYAHLTLVRDADGRRHPQFGIANALTVIRLVTIPTVVALFVLMPEAPGLGETALIAYAITAASDSLDGTLARGLHQTSDFGRMYDPICDILFNPSVALALAIAGGLPWWLAAVVVVRYTVALVGGVLAYVLRGPFRVRPTIVGKTSAFVLAVVVGLAAIDLCLEPDWLSDGLMTGLFIASGGLIVANTVYLLVMGIRYRSKHGFEDAIY